MNEILADFLQTFLPKDACWGAKLTPQLMFDILENYDKATKGDIPLLVERTLAAAEKRGLVVTVSTVPCQPLAMGNYRMVAEVRPGHSSYSLPEINQCDGCQAGVPVYASPSGAPHHQMPVGGVQACEADKYDSHSWPQEDM